MCKILGTQMSPYGEIVPKKSKLKLPSGLKKPGNSHSSAVFSSTVLLREVILALWTSKWVSASAYERCPLMGRKKCRVLEKLPGPKFGIHLWKVSAYGRCPLTGGVR